MTNKIGDLIYYKKPIEKSHNRQTENILCEIIEIENNSVILKRINSKENEENEWEILDNELKFKTERVETDANHIMSAGFDEKIIENNNKRYTYYQLNDTIIVSPDFILIDKNKNNHDIVVNQISRGFFITEDLKKFYENKCCSLTKLQNECKEITYLNNFLDFLKSEKIEFNLNEMPIN